MSLAKEKAAYRFRTESHEGQMLELMHHAAGHLAYSIRLADHYGHHKEKDEAFRMLGAVLDDLTVILTSGKGFSLGGRRARIPQKPEDIIEELRIARDIELMAVEIHMGRHYSTGRQESGFRKKALDTLDALKFRIRLTKPIVVERWPEAWTAAVEAEFNKVLEMEL